MTHTKTTSINSMECTVFIWIDRVFWMEVTFEWMVSPAENKNLCKELPLLLVMFISIVCGNIHVLNVGPYWMAAEYF